MVAKIALHISAISTSAHQRLCAPKKIIDQSVLSSSCTPNTDKAIFTSLRSMPFFQIRYAAIPMRAKSIVHTGANIQLGGAISGRTSVAYHVGIDEAVKKLPIMPAAWQIAMATINPTISFFRITSLYPTNYFLSFISRIKFHNPLDTVLISKHGKGYLLPTIVKRHFYLTSM